MKLKPEVIEQIQLMRKEGYKIKDICEKLSVNKNTVIKYSKKEKVE